MKSEIIFDEVRSEGVKNALARARQLCEIKWSAKRECIVNDNGSWGYLIPARSRRTHMHPNIYSGVPYSSTRVLDKFVGLDISPSTFVSATENPVSIVYTRDISDETDPAYNPRISNVYFSYGVVCSSLACYAMDFPMHYSTREWDQIPELYEVAQESIDDIAVADTIVTFNQAVGHTGGHVAVITDVARDSEGHVVRVEVTEGWEPFPRTRWDSRKAFEARMLRNGGKYLVFRNKNIDSVSPPIKVEPAPTDLMLDLGAFSVYREGDAVCFFICAPADALVVEGTRGDTARIEKERFESTECDGVLYTTCTLSELDADFYRAYLEINGEKSEAVCFSVMRANRPYLTKQNGDSLPRLAFTPVATNGTPLTRESSCLYDKDKNELLRCAPYALSLNGKLYTAYGALREQDGKLIMRPTTHMEDKDGNEITSFEIGEPIELYIAVAEEGEPLLVDFSDSHPECAYSLCPKEEAAVTFDQRLITEKEKNAGKLIFSAIPSPYNRFIGLSVIYKNEHGKLTSEPYPFIVL